MHTSHNQSTLHLPRLLCLHGGGTNARIFRAQCRVLERSLSPFFRLVYAEAPFSATPGPDVTSVYASMGPFKAWIHPSVGNGYAIDHNEAVEDAIMDAVEMDDDCGATGPVVGLLGFSQGARLCGSLLYARQAQEARASFWDCRLPDFKFAILLAGRGPFLHIPSSSCGCSGRSTHLTQYSKVGKCKSSGNELLRLPTLHVHGLQDPNLDLHRLFLKTCVPGSTDTMQWEGHHRVPIKTKDVDALVTGILKVASRAEMNYSF